MVTIEEYHAAREVVETYHRQLTEAMREIDDYEGASLGSFMRDVDLSGRLHNALRVMHQRLGSVRLETITVTDLWQMHGVGKALCAEFMEKQRQYLRSLNVRTAKHHDHAFTPPIRPLTGAG